jgi:O-acetyl-ADP-ribose deacetylase (regulator of RNase III)
MGITYKKGDVLQAFKNGEVDVVIHQTNCMGVMGSGIARQIKEQFPEAYRAYKNDEYMRGLKLGNFSYAWIETSSRPLVLGIIINLNGQNEYNDRTKCNTNYAALGKGLFDVEQQLKKHLVVAMPKIGAGLGGGDWKIIEAIIESVFYDREVFVYELE